MEDPTLLIHWLFSCLTFVIIVVRLVWRKVAKQPFNLGDYLSMAACVCAMTRLGLIHVVLTWGTNNLSAAVRKTKVFTAVEIEHRTIGSKLSIANRVFYNSYLWLQKLVLLDVYRRLLLNLRFEKLTIYSFLVVFFGTYVACQVTTFSECVPFHLYWQVVPDPGECVKAQLQLIVVGVLNIITDTMLLVLPIPLVFTLKTPWQRKLKLYALFMLGTFIIAITCIRLPINANNKDSQISRTTWASIELLTAAIVVNAPTIYGLYNKRAQAKSSSRSQGTGAYDGRGTNNVSIAHRSRTNPDDESYSMGRIRKPMDGIIQTKEVIVAEFRDTENRGRPGGKYANLPDDVENASSQGSQRGILKD
ncbi:hypothetical protein EDB81DRAFT_715620 [Dactylonectria macrodidyma]|uniref:Rhodopsin domain-containing protein n=1 Tax=Dactylonectria macrodidyma TaxID=307937 RepID=A0A9P9JK59_9HYPO|nr:hypothetical protein EDB81DRAFT_715620 [Dactylonectria macrodidyma]